MEEGIEGLLELPRFVCVLNCMGVFYSNTNSRLFSGEGGEGGRPDTKCRLLSGEEEVPTHNEGFLTHSVR